MRLLLAEDEEDLSAALVSILRHANYSVDAVYNGLDALQFLRTGNYDAAILDIMMPGADGLAVLKGLRSEGSSLPVLLLTAKGEVDDRVAGLDAGADDYLTKPFAAKELLARVRAITRRRGEDSGTVLAFGDCSLDRSSCMLTGPSGILRLAGKEFQMLEMLLEAPGTVISPARFLDRIWGYNTDAETNVVWVYVSSLRKRLKAVGSSTQIHASRGLGYFIACSEGEQV